ncbi:MAG: division/cell wall cluster transcriptional repressor MraZ [Thermomonas sp.]|uniref:division/cell wall cluster transcriptional repressor MraZ n=1 Tax=Thermomonas sp. TaxID=1971895 RepID=UPI001ED2B801|nr:division/cell wall cluster transcriptional repressor MraZ [Thermomonas sp.]MBV2210251.1 division/cell wall cluster transcriptional repressor MraZ [Thermomonas sp.]
MFQGENAITIDDKGRLAIPTAYRDLVAQACGNRLVVTYDVYNAGCLWLLQYDHWQRLCKQLESKGMQSPQARTLRRKLVAAAAVVELDGNSRISVPASMRAMTGIERRAVLLGNIDRFELWSERDYQAQMQTPLGDVDLEDGLKDLEL